MGAGVVLDAGSLAAIMLWCVLAYLLYATWTL